MRPGFQIPSAADVEAHGLVHIPYRDWCKWCSMGRGRGTSHSHARGSLVPHIGFDYFFIASEGVKKGKGVESQATRAGEKAISDARSQGVIIKCPKCLTIHCFEPKGFLSHRIPVKGVDRDDDAAGLVTSAVLWLGHL